MNVALKDSALLEQLRRIVGPRGFLEQDGDIAPHLIEWRGLWQGRARAVVKPANTAEVAAVMAACAAAGVPVVPQGGNTSLCGGSIPDDSGTAVVLSLSRMNRIRAIDPLNYTMTVEAGCVLAEIQRAAEAADRFFPLSLAAEGSCQIGGNISTNAGGIQVLRYGNTRELVLGLEVVLPDGRVWDGLRALRKDNTGYDLKQLFIGAEGTLGIITAAVLKLFPALRDRRTAFIAVRDVPAAIELLSRARIASADAVVSFELIPRVGLEIVLRHIAGTSDPLPQPYDHYVLLELAATLDGDSGLGAKLEGLLEAAMADGLVIDAAIAQNTRQSAEMWKLRESMSEAQKLEGASIKHDVSVPVSRLADFIAEASRQVTAEWPGVRVVAFGHVGDGNVHFNLALPVGGDPGPFLAHWGKFNEIVHDVVAAMNGSISAEHGIGRLKKDELPRYKSATELEVMARIRRALDPQGLMNPGRLF
ncbi:MAG: FAD-binding oxidoreductase [Thalassobaculales bacterium]